MKDGLWPVHAYPEFWLIFMLVFNVLTSKMGVTHFCFENILPSIKIVVLVFRWFNSCPAEGRSYPQLGIDQDFRRSWNLDLYPRHWGSLNVYNPLSGQSWNFRGMVTKWARFFSLLKNYCLQIIIKIRFDIIEFNSSLCLEFRLTLLLVCAIIWSISCQLDSKCVQRMVPTELLHDVKSVHAIPDTELTRFFLRSWTWPNPNFAVPFHP